LSSHKLHGLTSEMVRNVKNKCDDARKNSRDRVEEIVLKNQDFSWRL